MPHEAVPIGRILHFVLPTGPRKGECRAGIVVYGPGDPLGRVNFRVFTGPGDLYGDGELPVEPDVLPNHALRLPGTWHWAKECERLPEATGDHTHPEGVTDLYNCPACRDGRRA